MLVFSIASLSAIAFDDLKVARRNECDNVTIKDELK
jgi:hypothetical protein